MLTFSETITFSQKTTNGFSVKIGQKFELDNGKKIAI
jgi:hypothetical protein